MSVIDEFHKLYYAPAHQTTYLGLPLWKNPTDLFVLQELIWETKPQLIIETGTAFAASALYMAHFMEKAGIDGKVLSIDLEDGDSFQGIPLPRHERITYLRGLSSCDERVIHHVDAKAIMVDRRMVVLDSDHRKDHVQAEMDAYAPLVSPGSYMIVEDVNVNGHPAFPEHGPGPYEAVEEWLPKHPEFEQTKPYEKYLLSFHGWLRRT